MLHPGGNDTRSSCSCLVTYLSREQLTIFLSILLWVGGNAPPFSGFKSQTWHRYSVLSGTFLVPITHRNGTLSCHQNTHMCCQSSPWIQSHLTLDNSVVHRINCLLLNKTMSLIFIIYFLFGLYVEYNYICAGT